MTRAEHASGYRDLPGDNTLVLQRHAWDRHALDTFNQALTTWPRD
jgi:hypothetical protein